MIPSILKTRTLGMALALLALIIPASAQEILEDSRDALSQLIETKKLIAQERNEWETEKAIILDTIDTLEKQIEAVESRMKEIEETTSLGEQKRAELQERLADLQEMSAKFDPVISEYETRLRSIIPYLPQPLMDKIERLVGQLPKAGESGSRRLINNRAVVVIGILDEINNFHNSIQVHRELLNVAGEELFFSTMYYGLSTAYFVDENATLAGVGKPTSEGWTFEAVSGIENDVFDAVQIREKKMLARFVSLPVNVEDVNIN
jgi:hypothetical protein